MGILSPANWPAEAEATYLVTVFGIIALTIFVLLGLFLLPTSIKKVRENTYTRLVDSQRIGEETIEIALRLLRSHGHEQASVDWCLALSPSDMERLDDGSETQVLVVQHFATTQQELQERLRFLEGATWWSYRKYAWIHLLHWKRAQQMIIMFIVSIPFVAYMAAVLAAR